MKLDVDYFEVCSIDEKLINDILSVISDSDWSDSNYRKYAANMENTDSIPLRHTNLCAISLGDDAIKSIKNENLFYKFESVVSPVISLLKSKYSFDQYAAFIARLYANKEIGAHKDVGVFTTSCHRIHVPLKTNPMVAYCIDGKEYHWPTGKIYEFDNTRVHGVINRSDEDRIHLVINLYPKEAIK